MWLRSASRAVARYGPSVARGAARALSAGQFYNGMRDQYRGRKKARTGSANRSSTRTPSRSRSGSRGPFKSNKRYVTNSKYAGKFKHPKKSKINKMEVHLQKGYVLNYEVTGVVADPDCVYLGTAVHDGAQSIAVVLYALLRKLFKVALGIVIDSDTSVISTLRMGAGEANRTVINLYQINTATGAITILTTFTLGGSSTLVDCHNQFRDNFYQYSSQAIYGSAANNLNLYAFEITQYDNNVTVGNIAVAKGEIRFDEEKIQFDCKTIFKIQNRTLAADASADETNVSNAPLSGRCYLFNDLPKTDKHSGLADDLERTHQLQYGVILARAQDLNVSFKEPPLARTFINNKGVSKVNLAPGDVKSKTIYMNKKMPLLVFLRYVRISATNVGAYTYQAGQCILFGLEDVINVNAAQNISCAYEMSRQVGCHLVTKKKPVMLSGYGAATYSNP